ncbi:MAG: YitT family protein [Oscillospiraceae bacterium]|nr:YitT family protein [Oscillospiraceae bacterium]MBQ7130321.1 YitT family protein [Oscillospiraceae bacterium]
MMEYFRKYQWILATIAGSTVFALGFALFLGPNDMNAGGISGLAQIVVELTGFGTVGGLSILINLPLFILGGLKIGKQFFAGSMLGMVLSSLLIDVFSVIHISTPEPLIAVLYGGVICGLGLGLVFVNGTSTGGSDILVRLLKLRYRNVPIGQISMTFDAIVVILTGLVFQDISKALYTGITVFICGKVIDAVVYNFDFSKVALIISDKHEDIACQIGLKLDRGATFLHAEGSYSHSPKKVVLAAVKKQQLAELKELVVDIDPNAFIIVQEAHQVLGDGFSRYSKESL